MLWQLNDGNYELTITTQLNSGSTEPLSDADVNAVLALLQSRGVLSSTLSYGYKQGSLTSWTPSP